MRALLVYPSHKNCSEVEDDFSNRRIDVATFPPRTTKGTCYTPQNCWNADADTAEKIGFPVVNTFRPTCPHRASCLKAGYLGQLVRVQEAQVAVCTHARAEFGGFSGLTKGRPYVSVHENPIDLLRPKCQVSEHDLRQVQMVFNWMLNNPKYLDRFGDATRVDDEGNTYQDEEQSIRRDRQYQFYFHLANVVDDLMCRIKAAEATIEWTPTERQKRPVGVERTLFWATREAGDGSTQIPGDSYWLRRPGN